MRRRQAEVLVRDVLDFEEQRGELDEAWVRVAGIGDLVVTLTPDSLDQLWRRFYKQLDELVARDATDPSARRVSVVVAGFPRAEEGR